MASAISLVAAFAQALLATVALEVPLSLPLLERRDVWSLAMVALAQVSTNPLVELVCIASRWSPLLPLGEAALRWMLLAEVGAVVVEALIYRHAQLSRHPWLMSALLNACSFGLGIALVRVGLL